MVAERLQVLVGQVRAALLDEGEDLVALLGRRQPQVGVQALLHRGVAADPAEDEHDRGQEPGSVELLDHLRATRRPHPASPSGTLLRALAAPGRTPVPYPATGPVVAGDPQQLRVDPRLAMVLLELGGVGAALVGEQVVHPSPDDDVLVERHGSPFLHDGGGLPAHGAQPLAELLGVADRRGQRGQRHRLRQVDDHLLPDRAAHPVGEVVHLVHDHEAQAGEGAGPGVEHVAEHLGRHHHDRGLAVDAVVAGEQADLLGAVAADQVVELLVRQRLDRRGVERLATGGERQVHRELADDRLAGPRGRGHEHAAAVLELAARAELEVVEGEGEPRGEVRQLRVLPVAAVAGVGVRRGGHQGTSTRSASGATSTVTGSGAMRSPSAYAVTPAAAIVTFLACWWR